ncbi:unnamed protein product [Bemisia tabaci]|uniref:Uncharacterized protein n=1 Tax=Bemisia tabaci TaxID=7038 RepID=A0A9P0A3L8_BEMTA|nr:unnamed protein product [Bemisia tabaci]
MPNVEDRKFLEAQRRPDREGVIMPATDKNLVKLEKLAEEKKSRSEERIQRQKKFKASYETRHEIEDRSPLRTSSSDEEQAEKDSDGKSRRGTRNVIVPELALTYDALGVSCRDTVLLVASTAQSLGVDVGELNINKSTVHRKRAKNRSYVAQNIRQTFQADNVLTLHWDGKIVPDLIGKNRVDRIAVVVTGKTTDKLLGILKIEHGAGLATANVVFEAVESWNLGPNIKALSFDTTSVNSGDELDNIITFATEQLKSFQPRDDFREMLVLIIIFVGGVPPKGIKFMAPGAFNKTRWMSVAIYSLKIWMFQDQFKLTPFEKKGLLRVNYFILKVYAKCWYRAPSAIGAPLNDLELIEDLISFKKIDKNSATVALRKLSNHLWYVSETLVPLSLFDDRVPLEEKKKCVFNLKNSEGLPDPPARLAMFAEECPPLPELFTTNGMKFFEILGISANFLEDDVQNWRNNSEYLSARETVKALRVVNDHAERAVQLLQTYNRKITTKEDDFQDLLQVSSNFKRKIARSKKPKQDSFESLAG